MDFVPLDVTTTYSLLESTIRPRDLVKVAKKAGYTAVAIADFRVLYGAFELASAAHSAGLNPLVGAKFALQADPAGGEDLLVTAYATDAAGYAHLMQLSTLAMTRAATAPLTMAELTARLGGLALVVNPRLALVGPLSDGTREALKTLAARGASLGINLDFNAEERAALRELGKATGLPLIAFEPVNYLKAADYFPTQVLKAIKAGHQLEAPLQEATRVGDHWLRAPQEAFERYQAAGLSEAAARTGELAAKCQVQLARREPVLPSFPVPAGETAASWLKQRAEAGLAKRQGAPGIAPAAYHQRLDHELAVINQMGFADYFLIESDVMAFAHRQGILTGPGRGSAAGSLVAYALAITDVDPLKYDLLFERFLNPERAQMPDIDLDLPDTRREEVLAYLHQKYGHERVAQIITFGSLGAKQVVRDVSRVFGLPRYQAEQVSQQVARTLTPEQPTLMQALATSQSLANLARDQPLVGLLLRVASRLEGLPRHDSIHAAGIVLAATPLLDLVPLQAGSDPAGLLVTQFAKDPVEALGLLKMDFLGLRNLTTMARARDLIEAGGQRVDLKRISLADPATLALFQAGDTAGIFQFESRGIRRVLVDLHPDNFEELVAVDALYRPGPMDNIAHFIARKKGQERVTLPDPALASILRPTYGILVYQEQVMQVAVVMAGFTLGQADLLRRAMSKKKAAVMAAMKEQFLAGARAKGYDEAVAKQVFSYIDQFAHYGFNRSHAVAYSKMAFQMAYLKAHYPAAFLTALMMTEPDSEKVWAAFFAARGRGVTTHGPAINHSQETVSLRGANLYVGFDQLRGMRRDFARAIVEERGAHGDFRDLPDFINRMGAQWQKPSLIEPLIYSGAFDRMGYNRAEMVASLPALIEGAGLSAIDPSLAPVVEPRNEFPLAIRLDHERAALGVYLSGHPTSQYADLRKQLRAPLIKDLRAGQRRAVIGMVNRVRRVNTKKEHRPMAFLTVSDASGTLEVTVFNRLFDRVADLLQPNALLVISGKTEERNGSLQLLADQVTPARLANAKAHPATHRWVLRLPAGVLEADVVAGIKQLAKAQPGNLPVVIFDPASGKARQLPVDLWLAVNPAVQQGLINLVGRENLAYQQQS